MSETFDVVCIADPAIDHGDPDTNVIKYVETRDMKHLAFDKVEKPKVYKCRPLTRKHLVNWVRKAEHPDETYQRAFECGVLSVSGGDIKGNWKPRGSDKPTFTAMSQEELDEFDFCDIVEVGQVIYERSILPKHLPPRYGQPRSLPVVLAAMAKKAESRFVELSRNAAEQKLPESEGV